MLNQIINITKFYFTTCIFASFIVFYKKTELVSEILQSENKGVPFTGFPCFFLYLFTKLNITFERNGKHGRSN